jgi:hypothetical protein
MTEKPQKQGTVEIWRHESQALKGNPLDDPFERDVIVYLPPEYDENERYPTVYALTGFT